MVPSAAFKEGKRAEGNAAKAAGSPSKAEADENGFVHSPRGDDEVGEESTATTAIRKNVR